MISRQKTTVAVLRQLLGLSVEEFGQLIGKSISTVTKLENGLLKLSEETAFKIFEETGVSMQWLLRGNPREKPWHFFGEQEYKTPYEKEHFEHLQAAKKRGFTEVWGTGMAGTVSFVRACQSAGDWFSVHYAATKVGRAELAEYLMGQFLDGLVERLGKDDKGFLEHYSNAGIFLGPELIWQWCLAKEDGKSRVTLGYVEPPHPKRKAKK